MFTDVRKNVPFLSKYLQPSIINSLSLIKNYGKTNKEKPVVCTSYFLKKSEATLGRETLKSTKCKVTYLHANLVVNFKKFKLFVSFKTSKD